jgi:hypothetical protein
VAKADSGERRMMVNEGGGCVERQLWMRVGLTHSCSAHVMHDEFLRVGRSNEAFICA